MVSGSSDTYQRIYGRALALRNRNATTKWLARRANRLLKVRPPVAFTGWGLVTEHQLPWIDEHRWSTFRETLELLRRFEFTGEAGISSETVDSLAWRHWVVAFGVDYALTMVPRPGEVHVVECGVADGTTAFVAARELARLRGDDGDWHLHLYDSWGSMPDEVLLDSERQQAGRYANLSLAMTERNLSPFSAHTSYRVGYVPATFVDPPLPDEIVFAHVDLNASAPTLDCCTHLWPRLAPGGVLLFDDYAWLGFEDTKRVVDDFFADKPGAMLKWPTGQGMFLRDLTP